MPIFKNGHLSNRDELIPYNCTTRKPRVGKYCTRNNSHDSYKGGYSVGGIKAGVGLDD